MSPRNWRKCPKCREVAIAREKAADDAYGKVSRVVFDKLQREACNPPLEESMREDYDITIGLKEFTIDYSCLCTTCGFEFNIKKTFPVTQKGKA